MICDTWLEPGQSTVPGGSTAPRPNQDRSRARASITTTTTVEWRKTVQQPAPAVSQPRLHQQAEDTGALPRASDPPAALYAELIERRVWHLGGEPLRAKQPDADEREALRLTEHADLAAGYVLQ